MTLRYPTLTHMLASRAEEAPDALALRFLVDGEDQQILWTRQQLHERALAVALALAEHAAPGDRVLLLYPPGPDYVAAFFGCLYAGLVAVPAYPPDPARLQRTLPRLAAIVQDAGATVAATLSGIAAVAKGSPLAQMGGSEALAWVATDTLAPVSDGVMAPVRPDAVALLQYTSGSTERPRGVVLAHEHLLHNLAAIEGCLPDDDEPGSFVWLPPYHDMGLIGGILAPVYGGFPMGLMSPLHFLQRPVRWLQAMSTHRATFSAGPAFAYELCVRKTTPEQREALDLSAWRVAFNGAEPIGSTGLSAFLDVFASSGFRPEAMLPCYGLAEGSLIVTGDAERVPPRSLRVDADALERGELVADAAGQRVLVSCGPPVKGTEVRILDDDGAPQPDGTIGEIGVRGPSVGRGYWRRPERTEHTFGEWLRTGDEGVVVDGHLYVTGRLKDLVVIAGRNLHPHDLERTAVASDPRLRPGSCAAFAVTLDEVERVVIVGEVARSVPAEEHAEVMAAVARAVAREHGVRPHAVQLVPRGEVPRTSSGKVQRYRCRAAWLASRAGR
jgi:acyl-CoA synthetase (AMP-forming)/AMP-acid ligase II